jgi:hypothetical protein
MKRIIIALFALVAGASSVAAGGLSPADDLPKQDLRLLQISNAIMAANASLCDRTMPDLGVALQSTDQYSGGGAPPFAAPVAFAEVIPGSAAARAGIARDDGLIAIDGKAIAKRPGLERAPLRDSAFAMLAEHPAGTPLVLDIARGTERREVSLQARPECRALVEVLADDGNTAHSDGRVIQISYGLASRADDRQLAAMFAHELGHLVLHHRDRLSAAGVKKGLLGSLGRDRRLNLQAEAEADRMSVYLLANAGIDPRAGPGLWRSPLGRRISSGHQSGADRAKLMDAEIAAHLTGPPPYVPTDLLAQRTQPMR